MRVFVYYNLRKHLWSIKALDGPSKGRVVAHADKVLVRDATFRVSEAGRQRVIRERRKNVHAGVVGHLEAMIGVATPAGLVSSPWFDRFGFLPDDRRYAQWAREHGERVTYNPHQRGTFYTYRRTAVKTGARFGCQPIHDAPMVYLGIKRNVRAFDPCDMEG